ncbi:hypothetical protein BDQ17DRAFT_1434317 [Cyathus striatus]|nr:hypothetical protein BDQ17DRAFT_1434317 [Cyathus striatus]
MSMMLSQQVIPEVRGCIAPTSDSIGTRKHSKISGHAVRRSHSCNDMAWLVREHVVHLMGTNILLYSATTDEVNNFEEHWSEMDLWDMPESCQPSAFLVDFHNGPKSAWNCSVAKVFAIDFCNANELQSNTDTILDIMERFHTHIKSLKKAYAAKKASPQGRTFSNQVLCHWGRKQTRFHRRLTIFEAHPKLHLYVLLIQRLGAARMSSDKSDKENIVIDPSDSLRVRHPRFVVKLPRWRASSITQLLRAADSLHHIHDSTRFVPGLPRCAYNARWLARRRNTEFVVRPTKEQWDFDVDQTVFEFITASLQSNSNELEEDSDRGT